MAPIRYQGQIIKWQDDRGFGFIQSTEGGKDIFLHISAVQGASRRPLVGDTVLYELVVEPDGKRRAAKVSIQGATLTSPAKPSKPSAPRRQPPPTQATQPQRPSRPQKTTRRYSLRPMDLLVVAIAVVSIVAGLRAIARTTHQGQIASTTGQNQAAVLNTNQNPSTPTSHQSQPAPTNRSQPTPTNQSQPAPTHQSQPAPTNQSQPAPTNQSQPAPTNQSQADTDSSPSPSQSQTACVIKGNISISTGNRLYHLPGMEDYDITEIDLLKGERWFCTEKEAINNGWRKAPR